MDKKIYTHDEACLIVEMFEDILAENGISVPSPEDDERDEDDLVGLYGSTYSDLLDGVEYALVEIIERAKAGETVIPYIFSGTI